MSLSGYRVNAQIAVSDMARAREFYEAKLGLSPEGDQHEGSRRYACGGGSSLHVYAAPAHAGKQLRPKGHHHGRRQPSDEHNRDH